MAYKRKGQLASANSWRRHLRKRTRCGNPKFLHQDYWHRERFAERQYLQKELSDTYKE
jgi:hypothetical protein